jgi:hypothetical protein
MDNERIISFSWSSNPQQFMYVSPNINYRVHKPQPEEPNLYQIWGSRGRQDQVAVLYMSLHVVRQKVKSFQITLLPPPCTLKKEAPSCP